MDLGCRADASLKMCWSRASMHVLMITIITMAARSGNRLLTT